MKSAVVCKGVVKDFGSGDTLTRVLREVDVDVRAGELTMLVGPSGCGKTTLISVIAGLLSRSGGRLEVLGTDIHELRDAEQVAFRRQNMGFIFQQYNLIPTLTAAENAALPFFIDGMRREEAIRRGEQFLASLGMAERVHAYPRQLSGGQQQRVAIARALIHKPRLLLCDEPTAALDAQTGHRVMEMLTSAAVAPDRAVIVVTHDNRIFEFADRIVRMEDGRIISTEENHEKKTR